MTRKTSVNTAPKTDQPVAFVTAATFGVNTLPMRKLYHQKNPCPVLHVTRGGGP